MPVPIFHVNGDKPEHVVRAIDLALQYRQKFGYDAVVDILCYRKHGHNEADEPSFSHPIMYKRIKERPGVASSYGQLLDEKGIVPKSRQQEIRERYREQLQRALDMARSESVRSSDHAYQGRDWQSFSRTYSHEPVDTAADHKTLAHVNSRVTDIPEKMQIHPKLKRLVEQRKRRFDEGKAIDWAHAETLCFGSLLLEGTPVRLSGEDSSRGTFSQRHAVWWDMASPVPQPYIPLRHMSPDQAPFFIYDSPLSEFSVLGFEYGNSLVEPHMLALWEAQFGDFSNGAQVIIDQYVAAAESKWERSSGLVLVLPHGYEGQGPEHSSGFIERYLQLCAEDNLQVCHPTTPAQYFHLLRRQVKRPFRKPLVVMSPKSLLRSPEAVSPLKALTTGGFQEVMPDSASSQKPRILALCSGKIFYDLDRARKSRGREGDIAILRLEQLYPFPEKQLEEAMGRYSSYERLLWVQEESQNRGSWSYMNGRLGVDSLEYVGRNASASPATGSTSQHKRELAAIMDRIFGT
jgi:2-oxoglutarate dehydrogenase E1 component